MEKKSFTIKQIKNLESTVVYSAITGGPNASDLTLALTGQKKVFFWLDDTVKQAVDIMTLTALDHSRVCWEVKGSLVYGDVPFKFVLHYNSFERRGIQELGRGFIDVDVNLYYIQGQ